MLRRGAGLAACAFLILCLVPAGRARAAAPPEPSELLSEPTSPAEPGEELELPRPERPAAPTPPTPGAGTGSVPVLKDIVEFTDDPKKIHGTIKVLLVLTVLTLVPSILILMTSFTRIVIVLSFVRRALATQSLPPDQIIVGLSLFLTFAVMAPVFTRANRDALQPFLENKLTPAEALKEGAKPFREFMLRHVRYDDVEFFVSLDDAMSGKLEVWRARGEIPGREVPMHSLVPAFVISELKTAFWMGFLLYLPFLIIDLVVASVLMSMGMMFLPPIIVSLPFKVLLFVLVDGWGLIVMQLVRSFGGSG